MIFQAEGENEVNNELANRISLFYADATPMLKTLSDGTTKFVSEVRQTGNFLNLKKSSLVCQISHSHCFHPTFFFQNKNLPIENTTDCLSTMATVCKVMLETPWVTFCAAVAVWLSVHCLHVCNPSLMCHQGVPKPIRKRGDGVFLPAGHGRSHHPVRLRPPCGSFRQVVQNRCE